MFEVGDIVHKREATKRIGTELVEPARTQGVIEAVNRYGIKGLLLVKWEDGQLTDEYADDFS